MVLPIGDQCYEAKRTLLLDQSRRAHAVYVPRGFTYDYYFCVERSIEVECLSIELLHRGHYGD